VTKSSEKHTKESWSISPYWLVLVLALIGALFYTGYIMNKSNRVNGVVFAGLNFTQEKELSTQLPKVIGKKIDSCDWVQWYPGISD